MKVLTGLGNPPIGGGPGGCNKIQFFKVHNFATNLKIFVTIGGKFGMGGRIIPGGP